MKERKKWEMKGREEKQSTRINEEQGKKEMNMEKTKRK
jgi:hypothetical protein